MKTFCSLCRLFNRMFPGYDAFPDMLESRPGCYRVYISTPDGLSSLYIFRTCAEFAAWIDGVVME